MRTGELIGSGRDEKRISTGSTTPGRLEASQALRRRGDDGFSADVDFAFAFDFAADVFRDVAVCRSVLFAVARAPFAARFGVAALFFAAAVAFAGAFAAGFEDAASSPAPRVRFAASTLAFSAAIRSITCPPVSIGAGGVTTSRRPWPR
jgi:hypothetical protein